MQAPTDPAVVKPRTAAANGEVDLGRALTDPAYRGVVLDVLDCVAQAAGLLAGCTDEKKPAAGDTTGKAARRRRKKRAATEKPLTPKQAEAVQIVGETKGNFAEAGRRLGVDRKTVQQHYRVALKKMGQTVVKAATQRLPEDKRGQANVSEDRRR